MNHSGPEGENHSGGPQFNSVYDRRKAFVGITMLLGGTAYALWQLSGPRLRAMDQANAQIPPVDPQARATANSVIYEFSDDVVRTAQAAVQQDKASFTVQLQDSELVGALSLHAQDQSHRQLTDRLHLVEAGKSLTKLIYGTVVAGLGGLIMGSSDRRDRANGTGTPNKNTV